MPNDLNLGWLLLSALAFGAGMTLIGRAVETLLRRSWLKRWTSR